MNDRGMDMQDDMLHRICAFEQIRNNTIGWATEFHWQFRSSNSLLAASFMYEVFIVKMGYSAETGRRRQGLNQHRLRHLLPQTASSCQGHSDLTLGLARDRCPLPLQELQYRHRRHRHHRRQRHFLLLRTLPVCH